MKAFVITMLALMTAVGGLFAAGSGPADIVERVTEKVRTELTKVELNRLAQIIRLDHEANGSLPPESPEDFAAFVRERSDAKNGRDPSLDLWGRPLFLLDLGDDLFGIVSFGVDGRADRLCREEAPDAEIPDVEIVDDPSVSELLPAAPGPDDVCVVVELRSLEG